MNDLQRREERFDRKERLRHTVERFNKICYRKEPGYVREWFNDQNGFGKDEPTTYGI